MELSPEYKRARLIIIIAQCLGLFPYVLINDSPVIILYTSLLGCSEFVSIATTAFLSMSRLVLTPVFAVVVDRVGKKRIMIPAFVVTGVCFAGLALAPLSGQHATGVVMGFLALTAIAIGIDHAGWFPLLKDIVPRQVRGNFFGVLRASWSSASMLFLFLISLWAGRRATVPQLQLVIVAGGIMVLIKAGLISLLPEKDTRTPGLKLGDVARALLSQRELVSFCIYLFILYVLVGCTLPVTYVMAKTAFCLPDNYIINLTSLVMIANILGFITGGIVNDRYGSKLIFLCAHFGFGLVCLLLLTVNAAAPALYVRIALAFLVSAYGFLFSASSIAVTTQLFALARGTIQATALAVGMAMYMGGSAFSRLGSGWLLDRGMLAKTWTLFSLPLTAYHTIFLLSGCGVIAAVILLTLVPSVMEKVQDYPKI